MKKVTEFLKILGIGIMVFFAWLFASLMAKIETKSMASPERDYEDEPDDLFL